MKFTLVLSIVFIVNCMLYTSAYAYIDPNTGGFFFQTVAPFVYAMLGAIVIFWKRITGFFKGLFSKNKEQDSSVNNE